MIGLVEDQYAILDELHSSNFEEDYEHIEDKEGMIAYHETIIQSTLEGMNELFEELSNDYETFEEAVVLLLIEVDRIKQFSENSIEKFKHQFDEEELIPKLMDSKIWEELIGKTYELEYALHLQSRYIPNSTIKLEELILELKKLSKERKEINTYIEDFKNLSVSKILGDYSLEDI